MANVDNLIPFTSEQSQEEAKKNGRKGGIASGKARRKRKAIAETLNILMSQKVKEKKSKTKLKNLGISSEDQDLQMLLIVSEYQRAVEGDKESRDFILKSLGENISTSDNSTGNIDGVVIVDDCEFIDDEEDNIKEKPI